MDQFGNPIPGSSKEFECEDMMDSTANYDFAWLENEFVNDNQNIPILSNDDQNISFLAIEDQNLGSNNIFEMENIDSNPCNNINDFFEEINNIDFSQNKIVVQNNDTLIELLERCNHLIEIVGRNIVYLEDIVSKIQNNIDISKRNADKAFNCILFESKSMSKTRMLNLKKKANLANFFKIGLSNCPQNPHLMELYETGRLILSYNGRFILEECVERNLWNQEFKNKLEQAIHVEVLHKIKTPMLKQQSHLSSRQEVETDPVIKKKITLEMMDIEKELKVITNTPFKNLVFQFMDSDIKYDWLHIGKITNKPDMQCQRFWNLILKPHISRAKWTKDEDDKLFQIVQKYKEKNWRQIAHELDTNRNELQCFVHYQKCKKMTHKKGKWSKPEDQKLLEIIKENSINTIINWQKVYFAMRDNGRSVDQIYNRWTCSLKPGIKKGFLNDREKAIINMAQKKNMPASVVSMNLTNRTPIQIRNAFRRISLYDQTNRGSWMSEEDKMLLHAVKQYPLNKITWTQVATQVPGRNAEQCRHRFKLLEKKIQKNPNIDVENFPRVKRKSIKYKSFDQTFDTNNLQETFRQNRQFIKDSNQIGIETIADRKLKKSFLDNVFISKHCNFSSKCDLYKYILDYLGADLVVPKDFLHKDDLLDEGLMSMMTYLKECCIDNTSTLESDKKEVKLKEIEEEEEFTDIKFTYEGVDGILKTSDIINSDLSEIEGLFDIRMRDDKNYKMKSICDQNSIAIKNKTYPLSLHYMGSVPPNFETFRMLYSYLNSLSTILKNNNENDNLIGFNWNNEESKHLFERLIAIFRWPVFFSNLIDYQTPNVNMIVNTEDTVKSNNIEINSQNFKNKYTFSSLKEPK